MRSNKQRVFLFARKRNVDLVEVYEVLGAVGAKPTNKQRPVQRATGRSWSPGGRREVLYSYRPASEMRDCSDAQAAMAIRILRDLVRLRG